MKPSATVFNSSAQRFSKLQQKTDFVYGYTLISQKERGFTLIEAMITIAIIGLIGLILMGIITNGFSGSTKTQLLGNIKQDGQTSLNLMENSIKFSQGIICPLASPGSPGLKNTLVIQDQSGNLKRFYLTPSTTNTNGTITQDSPTLTPGVEVEAYCNLSGSPSVPSASPQAITDDSNISVEGLSFTVRKENGAKPSVEIDLTIGSSKTSRNIFAEKSRNVNFKTTVQLK